MQIADLKIRNFRGVQSAYLRFAEHTMLMGPNNCGKSTIIERAGSFLALIAMRGATARRRDSRPHQNFKLTASRC
jgi:recombinational DNA repair ATPase RecF